MLDLLPEGLLCSSNTYAAAPPPNKIDSISKPSTPQQEHSNFCNRANRKLANTAYANQREQCFCTELSVSMYRILVFSLCARIKTKKINLLHGNGAANCVLYISVLS